MRADQLEALLILAALQKRIDRANAAIRHEKRKEALLLCLIKEGAAKADE